MVFSRTTALSIGLVCLGTLAAIAPGTPTLSQPLLELAQRADNRVGQVNPQQPIKIELVNGGRAPVQVVMTQPASDERRLPPRGTISFGTTHTSYLPPPIYLFAYPTAQDVGINLYVVSTAKNTIKIVVSEQASQNPGDTNLIVEANGAVYVK